MINREKRIIYIPIMGRIGNQLFQYAFAYSVKQELDGDCEILIDEYDVISSKWTNSLREYDLEPIKYISRRDKKTILRLGKCFGAYELYKRFAYTEDSVKLFEREKRWQRFFNRLGLIVLLRGYYEYKLPEKGNIFLYGYFQSEKFFVKYRNEIRRLFDQTEKLSSSNYPHLDELTNRNSVCISVKIEHNIGSSIYDVCSEDYYRSAIKYIEEHVDNPLYFLCSDNVERAKELFFKGFNRDVVCQPDGYEVSLTLCAMSKCKHFIINNTSFGWWAQYLSDFPNKIVVAPAKWKANDDPVSIYDNQDCWHLI